MTLGAYIALSAVGLLGIAPFAALPFAIIVTAAVAVAINTALALIQFRAFRHIHNQPIGGDGAQNGAGRQTGHRATDGNGFQRPQAAQGMVPRYPLFGRKIAEQSVLLAVITSHLVILLRIIQEGYNRFMSFHKQQNDLFLATCYGWYR